MDFIVKCLNGSDSSDSGPPQDIDENKTSKWADIFSLFSPVLFLLDIALDIRTAVGLYNQENYFSLAILVVLLIGSTVLVNIYSWIWYNDKKFDGAKTKLEKYLKPWFTVLHFFTLGIFIRHLAAASASLKNLRSKNPPAGNEEGTTNQGDSATPCVSPETRSHDEPELEESTPYRWYNLRTLQLFESYTESAPQIVLMFTITLRDECWILNYYTGAKILVSVVSIICSTAIIEYKYYEQVLKNSRSSLIQVISYVSWKMPLLASRLSALALFASVEPCFIFTHFICSWLVLFFVATCSQTELMEKGGRGEWLFRATLGVMWYFIWFSWGLKGQTGKIMWLYYFYMQLDIIFLSGWWYWTMISDPPHFEISPLKVLIIIVSVAILSQIGVMNRAVHLTILQNIADERNEKQKKLFELNDSDSKCNPKRMVILCTHFY